MVSRQWLAYSVLCLFCLLVPPASAEGAVLPSVDPVDDPWLSQQGPAITPVVEVSREQVIAAWNEAPAAPYARAAALRRVRLELGLGDLLAPARVILAGATEENPEIFSGFAHDLAPDVPSIQIEHAQALARSGDIGAATKALGRVLSSVALSLPTQLWLVENFAFLILVVVLAAAFGFILLAALEVFTDAAHDLGDLIGGPSMPEFARSAALAALLLIPFIFGEGIVGLALGLFLVAFAYGRGRQRNALAMAAVLLVIGLYPLTRFVSIATTLMDEDPVATSVMAVIAGTETGADIDRLEAVADEDLAAGHALAYRARRYGLRDLSATRLESLKERYPDDGFVLAALGNIEMRRGNTEAAIGFYEKAATGIDSAILLFNQSQAYASEFQMEVYEETLVRAQKLDGELVAELSSLGGSNLVADLPFPVNLLRKRFLSLSVSQDSQFDLASLLAPGQLGASWFRMAGAFAVAVLGCLLFANRFDHASQCGRCGDRICTRCQDTVWSEDLCEDCHHLFKSSGATDPSLRMARLELLSKRESRINRAVIVGALMIPGLAGIAAKRPDFAMIGLLFFAWIATWMMWPAGIFEDPLLMGNAAVFYLAIPGVLSMIGYGGVVTACLVARKNR